MGIVNVTPDSFSDGGKYLNANDAVAHAEKLVQQVITSHNSHSYLIHYREQIL